ncbi:MAG TPA: mandelate racemase/muconate lactonizing enzyme family protein [Bacteroidales bacterium]|nr:mandelate racemase/muconate lactonizing enzyme family protein [Bacteroidales bacterium]HOX75503.1 mandelate racemase/muconate lactonizing enzyme family protein [Bacteroidales bacterium]HPM89019.1 mandelate racemase/muconate lactonizing enzyme family protein [Bacteroidales bacterium]HQM69815.1 mandelate racemase/muconate lactonizing enzyme family protein [Bacteroidales bacterium]
MKTNRRHFISAAAAATIGAAAPSIISCKKESGTGLSADEIRSRYEKLDGIIKQPVLKKDLFKEPVIIDTVELLHYDRSWLCRVRSKDGAEGMSVGHSTMSILYPVFLRNLQPFFIGQDARELDLILERVFIYNFNFRYNGITLGLPLATIEFAILDMLGRKSGKPTAELIGEVHNPEVGVYTATEFREKPLEEHFELIKKAVAEYDTNALKVKIGYQYAGTKDIHYAGVPGKTEKLIPMLREFYGDDMALYADSNGYYDVHDAIKVGRLLEENKYRYFEEPVMFDHFEDIKAVADALILPVANGEQDQSFVNFRWLIANDGLDIVQPDNYYFGGMIRSMKVALMAHAFGKEFIPHMSGGGLGFLYNTILVSAAPNAGEHHEFKGLDTNVIYECPTSPLLVIDGKIKAPTGPGMGVNFDRDFIKKHEIVKI